MFWTSTLAKDDMHACFGIGAESFVLSCSIPFPFHMRCNIACSFSSSFWYGIASTICARGLLLYLWIYRYKKHTRTAQVRARLGRLLCVLKRTCTGLGKGPECVKVELGTGLHV